MVMLSCVDLSFPFTFSLVLKRINNVIFRLKSYVWWQSKANKR